MGASIFRRSLSAIPVLFGILVITFLLARKAPSDPCAMLLGPKSPPQVCTKFLRDKGLDKPVPVQLAIYIQDVLTGDFGHSIRFNRPAFQIIVERLPATIELGVMAYLIAIVVGIPVGILSALYKKSPLDNAAMVGANLGVSLPIFWSGLILMYIFAVLLRDTPFWLPPSGRLSVEIKSVPFFEVFGIGIPDRGPIFYLFDFVSNFYIFNSIITLDFETLGDTLKHLILPAVTLSIIPLSVIARLTRASLLEELGKNYILTARAKGLRYFFVVSKHGFPNALLPIVTIMGLQISGLLSGAVLTETIYGFPGLGRMLFESIVNHDYPVTQAITVVVAVIYVIANLMIDIWYTVLDPRIRLE